MKKLFYSTTLLLTVLTAQSQTPNVTMTTNNASGSYFSFDIAATGNSTPIQVDWGNGILIDYIVDISRSSISGELTGYIIKIYGEGISTLDLSSKNLTSLNVSGATSLKNLYCQSNLLIFSTLPTKQSGWMIYDYSPQNLLKLPKNKYDISETIDLSGQLTVNGNTTSYIWKTKSGTTLVKGVDYSENNGKFTFLIAQPDNLYCQMTNLSFPGLTLTTETLTVPPLTPAITMSTSTATGSIFYFVIAANAYNTPIQVDWGDGSLTDYTIDSISLNLYGTLKSNIIRIFGAGISSISLVSKELTALDVSGATVLSSLNCYSNQLTNLDVSKNTALTFLNCGTNQLTAINLLNNKALTEFYCWENLLPELNVSKNTELTVLEFSYNLLTTIDLSNNAKLTSLSCCSNLINSLGLNYNTKLKYLDCYYNQLSKLDISKNTELTTLYCNNNQLTHLDVSKNSKLETFFCYNNMLVDTLDVSRHPELTTLYCNNNQITTLDVSYSNSLSDLNCSRNIITSLDVSYNTWLTRLNCQENRIATLDLLKDTVLQTLNCSSNQLTTLDVSNNVTLSSLNCSSNQLTELNLDTVLTTLYCSENLLRALDISKSTKLTHLVCYSNQLEDIDLSKDTTLISLYCSDNQLTYIDLSMNPALEIFHCESNLFTFTTLPIKQTTWTSYIYSPQQDYKLPKNQYGLSEAIDLTSQLTANGETTTYSWKTQGGTILKPTVDYSASDGTFTFLQVQTDSVYCQMNNKSFPDLNLNTNSIAIASSVINKSKKEVSIYPNPIKGTIYIERTEGIVRVEIFTIDGTKVYVKEGNDSKTVSILTANLPEGILIVKVFGRNGITESKVIKE